MEMTNYQKLVLTMLCDIHEKLEIQDSVDPKLVMEAVHGDNTWGLSWAYPGILENEPNPPHVEFVANVLQMWEDVERSYEQLSDDDKVKVETAATPFGNDPKFPGFDGNNEGEYLSAARFMVENLDRFSDFKGRVNNSHFPAVDGYQRMLNVHEGFSDVMQFGRRSADELIALLNERRHPDNR
ncbi:YfbU family protein [Pseudomonas luteola]|uniref:YfbU family protein n=1 Tax=Pseudomonas luteola TaxID=47886 RepID=UPI0015E46093|nr:YfbU family protein [Pseudomonas zeshuii]MBA1250934.1 hypothetical protein [Pseudomonas zeshuii]